MDYNNLNLVDEYFEFLKYVCPTFKNNLIFCNKLCNILFNTGKKYEIYNCKNILDNSYVSMLESINNIENFFKGIGRNDFVLKIEDYIKNGMLDLETYDENDLFSEYKADFSGKYDTHINLKHKNEDSAIIIHELMHRFNNNDDGNNFVRTFLTEFISILMEEIYILYMKKDNYINFKLNRINSSCQSAFDTSTILNMLTIYNKIGRVLEEDYDFNKQYELNLYQSKEVYQKEINWFLNCAKDKYRADIAFRYCKIKR